MMMSDAEIDSPEIMYGHVALPTGAYHDNYQSSDDDVTTTDDDVMGTYIDELPPDQVLKPLMHPRARQRPTVRVKSQRNNPPPWQRLLWPLVYLFIFLASLAAFVCLIIYVVNVYTNKLFHTGAQVTGAQGNSDRRLVGCSDIKVEDVWVVGLPKLLTESAMRLLDVNQDGVNDIIMGYATGVDKLRSSKLVCDIYFNGSSPCGGGMMALDGRTGQTLWMHWAEHEIFSLNCGADLDQDGINDCIGGGRAGTFEAASGKTGQLLWKFVGEIQNLVMNAYTGQFIGDIDKDGVHDIVNIHGGDPLGEPGSNTRLGGKLVVLSGRTGEVLQVADVPDGRESYYSPVIYRRSDGTAYLLYGTGGETHSGSLWVITLHDLLKGDVNQSKALYTDRYKGIMTPPVLVDISGDGTEDIVFATFNSTVMAIDGETFKPLWKFSYPDSETYATPAPGYYNDDEIPDFLIRLQIGPGFPIYYYSITTILDGATGKPVVVPYLRDSVGSQTSPLTISMQGQGHDIFLYWISDCRGAEGAGDEFKFQKGTNVHEQSRTDFCRLRFKTSGFSKMLAISQRLGAQGKDIYNSEERYHIERSAWVNASYLADEFLRTHPDHMLAYRKWQEWVAMNQEKWRRKDKEREDNRDHVESGISDATRTDPGDDEEDDYYRTDSYRGKEKRPGDNRGSWHMAPKDDDSYRDDTEYLQTDPEYGEQGGVLRNQIESIVEDILDGREDGVWESLYGRKDGQNPDRQDSARQYNPAEEKDPKRMPYDLTGSADDAREREHIGNYGRTRKPVYRTGTGHSGRSPDEVNRIRSNYDELYRSGGRDVSHNDLKSGVTGAEDKYPLSGDGTYKRGYKSNGELPTGEARIDMKSAGGGGEQKELHDKYMQSFGHRKSLRKKRHVGPHDEGGLQRLISTGTLAPPLLKQTDPDYSRSMDVLFATYWFYPAKTKILLEEDNKCIEDMMKQEVQRLDPQSEFYGMDHDAYEHEVTDLCLEKSGHIPEQGTYESQSTYNPYNVHMGQMTVYRLRVRCECDADSKMASDSHGTTSQNAQAPQGDKCATFLPHEKQQWPSYMGAQADSHWVPRR